MSELSDELQSIEAEGLDRIAAAATVEELRAVEGSTFGKRSPLAALNQRLGAMAADERKAAGQVLNAARTRLSEAAAARRGQLESEETVARLAGDRLDLSEVFDEADRGHLTLVTQTMDELVDTFVGMGFTVAEGREVEDDWHTFEALNFPKGHPARSGFDTLYVQLGEPETVLVRPHTSPMQIRVMESQPPPIYTVMPGRCYRKDTPDARHIPGFHQIEMLVVDEGITFGDLAGTIETFTTAYFGPDIHSRLRPAFFPFTEPSAEYEITCTVCKGDGCRTCSQTGWIELGGCGMVHPNVFRHVGIDPERWSGFAFGFGVDRLAQMRYAIEDMRILLDNDIRFTSQF